MDILKAGNGSCETIAGMRKIFQLWITPRDVKGHNALIAERNALCFLVIETAQAERANRDSSARTCGPSADRKTLGGYMELVVIDESESR